MNFNQLVEHMRVRARVIGHNDTGSSRKDKKMTHKLTRQNSE